MEQRYLAHHGILGQKWGVRRYQNPDGTLTAAGKKRYGADDVDSISSAKGIQRRLNDLDKARARIKRNDETNQAVYLVNKTIENNRLKKLISLNDPNTFSVKLKDGSTSVLANDEVANSAKSKADTAAALMRKNQEYLSKGYNETIRLHEKVKQNNFGLSTKTCKRYMDVGELALADLLAGGTLGLSTGIATLNPIVGASIGLSVAGATAGAALKDASRPGLKYKVNKKSNKLTFDGKVVYDPKEDKNKQRS